MTRITTIKNKTAENKRRLLDALAGSLGIITAACAKCGLSRNVFYEYCRKDAAFAQAVDDVENSRLDFVESKLLSNIKNGDTTAIIFYLKMKGRKRGYTERQDIDIKTNGEPMRITFGGLDTEQIAEMLTD